MMRIVLLLAASSLPFAAAINMSPRDMLPPGVSSGLMSQIGDGQEYMLTLSPPEEDSKLLESNTDSVMKIERTLGQEHLKSAIVAKQRLMHAEQEQIRGMVGNSFLSNFGDLRPRADFQVTLHAPEETANDVSQEINAIRRAEARNAASRAREFAADKARLLNAAKIAIRRGNRRGSFLEPMVPPIAFQEAMQAGLPAEIHVNYDVPNTGLISELATLKSASDAESRSQSFLEQRAPRSAEVFFEKAPADYEASYQQILSSLKRDIDAALASAHGSSFMESPSRVPSVNVFTDIGKGQQIDANRLRSDLYAYAFERLDAYESRASFLVGDASPYPLPALSVSVETMPDDSIAGAEVAARASELASLGAK